MELGRSQRFHLDQADLAGKKNHGVVRGRWSQEQKKTHTFISWRFFRPIPMQIPFHLRTYTRTHVYASWINLSRLAKLLLLARTLKKTLGMHAWLAWRKNSVESYLYYVTSHDSTVYVNDFTISTALFLFKTNLGTHFMMQPKRLHAKFVIRHGECEKYGAIAFFLDGLN